MPYQGKFSFAISLAVGVAWGVVAQGEPEYWSDSTSVTSNHSSDAVKSLADGVREISHQGSFTTFEEGDLASSCSSCNSSANCSSCGRGGFLDKLGITNGNAGLFGGFIKRSDHSFDDFISPISNPIFFEDPRTLTEARFLFLDQNIPGSSIIGQGDVQVYAMQIRAALSERLSLIANKDGYASLTTNALGHRQGWVDLSLGLKYNLIRDPRNQLIVSAGAIYEMAIGTQRVFQGNGDGEFNLFLTGGKEIAPGVHWLAATGVRLPSNSGDESQVWYLSNHLDKKVTNNLYAVWELNLYHWIASGDGSSFGTTGQEGFDLMNLGSTNVTNNDILTMAVGPKYKPNGNFELGVAYEFPIGRKDVMDNRINVDAIFRY